MKCPLCGREEPFELIDELEFELAGKPTLIRPVMCQECGLVFLNPPTDPALLFDYYTSQNRYASETTAYREQVEMIAAHFKGGAILDIGSYDGRLLRELSDEFFSNVTLYGVEPDKTTEPVIDYIRWQDFGTVYLLGLEFDLITMGHVLEHLPNPIEVLEMCCAMLSRKGLVFIEVPDLYRPQVQLEPYWTAQHLWYFTEHTLRNLLAKTGFEIVNIQNTAYNAIRIIAKQGKALQTQNVPDLTRELVKTYAEDHQKEVDRIGQVLDRVQGRYAVFGAGEHSRWLAKLFPNFWSNVELILDSNSAKWNTKCLGRNVVPVAMLPDYIESVVISSYDTQEEMANIIGDRAVRLYKPNAIKAYDTWA